MSRESRSQLMARSSAHLALLVFAMLVTGCGRESGLPRVRVQGKVTFQGAPVTRGLITFRPSAGSAGPSAGGAIRDGVYRIDASEGPTPGSHDIIVQLIWPPKEGSQGPFSRMPRFQTFALAPKVIQGDSTIDVNLPE
jgi:hypothetical protein